MDLRIGDQVAFLNDVGGGKVHSFQPGDIVVVSIEDGFEIPIHRSEIIKTGDSPDTPQEKTQEAAPVMTRSFSSPAVSDFPEKVALLIGTDSDQVLSGDFVLHLMNHTSYDLLFNLFQKSQGEYQLFNQGIVGARSSFELGTILRTQISDISGFGIQISPYQKSASKLLAPKVMDIKLKASKLYKEDNFQVTPHLSKPACILDICSAESLDTDTAILTFLDNTEDQVFEQVSSEKNPGTQSLPKANSNRREMEMEVDLHIEELLEDHRGMSNSEIIQHQLRVVRESLDKAKSDKVKRVIFIHGIGNGRLKTEVRKMLNEQTGVVYQDASFKKYGYGATLALLK